MLIQPTGAVPDVDWRPDERDRRGYHWVRRGHQHELNGLRAARVADGWFRYVRGDPAAGLDGR
ncbi:MAG: hypothetical protein WCG47_16720, partial [Dermatophilaceae bacterium]